MKGLTLDTPVIKTDLIAQAFCSNTYFDSFYLHFTPSGCAQADRLTIAGNHQRTGYHNTVLQVLKQIQLAQAKGKRLTDNLTVNIIEEYLPIHDNGRVTNEGIVKVGTVLVKKKNNNF